MSFKISSLLVLLAIAFPISLSAQSPSESAPQTTIPVESILPSAWIGTWKGQVELESLRGEKTTFQMELSVETIAPKDRLAWRITYDGAAGKSVREYELVAKNPKLNQYVIDEKNGIEIDATLLGKALVSHFTVGGQTIWTKYELVAPDNREILFELITAPEDSKSTSGGKEGIPEVLSLKPSSRQFARLERISTSTIPEETDVDRLIAWKKLETEAYRGKQDDIYFVDDQVGWYANGAGKIFKSIDGGDSWQLQKESKGTFFRCLAFIDREHGFAGNIGPGYFPNVTDTNPLYETTDGGTTWNAVTSIEGPPVVGLCAMQVLREEYINAGQLDTRIRIVGVGRVGGPTAMIVSDDLGKTWQPIDIADHAAMAFDVFFFNRDLGFIAAATNTDVANSHASILRTEDGGKSWEKVYESSRPYELTWKIAFPSREVGYVTIQSYNPDPSASERFVAKTTDGGKSWIEVPLTNEHAVRQFGVAFLNDQVGWIGAVPHGFFTRDGGQSWSKADIGNAVNKIRLLSTESLTLGFAIGTHVYRLQIPTKSLK